MADQNGRDSRPSQRNPQRHRVSSGPEHQPNAGCGYSSLAAKKIKGSFPSTILERNRLKPNCKSIERWDIGASPDHLSTLHHLFPQAEKLAVKTDKPKNRSR